MKTYISREKYLNRIKPFINKELIKVIVGQRRTGKSYFLFEIMDFLKNNGIKDVNILYINKESHDFDRIKNYEDLIKYVELFFKQIKSTKYLFIDEIQEIEQFERAIRSLAKKGFDIYCTGSNSNMLSSDLATLLTGRYIEVEIFSLSYTEFLDFHKLTDSKETFLKYIKYGGLPYLRNLELENTIVYDYLQSVYNTILLKDIVKKFNIRNVDFLNRLIDYIAENLANLFSAKNIVDFLKIQNVKLSPNTILNYLSYFVSTFLIFDVKRLNLRGKKIFEVNEKYYFNDLGIKHSLRRFEQTDIGRVMENLVFMHLKRNRYDVNVGVLSDKEIDFVAEKQSEKVYVQVAYLITDDKVKEREFGNLLKIKDNYRKIVVSMDEYAGGNYLGIEQMHIRNFLMMDL